MPENTPALDATEDVSMSLHESPAPEAVPEAGDQPEYVEKLNNLAKHDALTEAVRAWASSQLDHFDQQSQRTKFCSTGGTMDVADRMWRVGLRRQTSSAQYQDTLSDVASVEYFNGIRTLSSNVNAIFFPDTGELPAVFEPEINTTEYSVEQGQSIAVQQNALQQFTQDEDKRPPKFKALVEKVLTYSMWYVVSEWVLHRQNQRERVPVEYDPETGTPTRFEWRDVERIVRECPTFELADPSDIWLDAQIDEMELQRCIIRRRQMSWEDLAAAQERGEIVNVDKLEPVHLYRGENEESKDDRSKNADEDAVAEENGLYDVYEVLGMMPISENEGKRGKTGYGKWSTKNRPLKYWATFSGDIRSGGVVCHRLIRNPFNDDKYPIRAIYSHRDTKGHYHAGFPQRLEPLYWEAVTCINQSFDNVHERNAAPYSCDGPVFTRDLTFRPNKLIKFGRGTQFKRIDVPDTTSITMPMYERIIAEFRRTLGVDRVVTGQAMGARTSAQEAMQALDQALLPIDDVAGYIAEQVFDWMWTRDAMMWRQWGNPNLVLQLTHNHQIVDVNPAMLWGPFKVKITAVTRFRNDTVRRREINSMLQNVLPVLAPIIGKKGVTTLFRKIVWPAFNLGHAAEVFPPNSDYDATQRAREVVGRMLREPEFWYEPSPDEDHATWLAVFEQAEREYMTVPTPDQDGTFLNKLRQQIAIRKGMASQATASMQQPQVQQQPQELPGAETPAEQNANPLEAAEGAMANV